MENILYESGNIEIVESGNIITISGTKEALSSLAIAIINTIKNEKNGYLTTLNFSHPIRSIEIKCLNKKEDFYMGEEKDSYKGQIGQ